MTESSDAMEQFCKCGRKWRDHSFAEFMTCQYKGTPLKDGGTFTIDTAHAVIEKAFGRREATDE